MEHQPKITIEELVEITLAKPDDFLKVKETLTRIGISSKTEKKLYQSCHILHKRGKYYIVHFKELFALDGLPSTLTEADIARRNTIVTLLDEWGLVKNVDPAKTANVTAGLGQIKIIPHKEKGDWELVPKYHIGKKF
jgi:hypothetical protein